MAKLEFKVTANTQPVDDLYESIDRLEKQAKGLGKTDLGLDNWTKQFNKFKREQKEIADDIERTKRQILSFNDWGNQRGLDELNWKLIKSKREYDNLMQAAVDTANRFSQSFSQTSAALQESKKNVDAVTWRLIEQKEVVANLQSEVRRLNEAYRSADQGDKSGISAQISSKKQQLEDERVSLNNLRAEQERAKLTAKSFKDEMSNYQKSISDTTAKQDEADLSLKKVLATFGGAAAVKAFVSDMINVRGTFQKTQMAFETMLGSKEKADMLMSQMIQTAAKTPFDLQGVADGAKQLLAYGTEAKDINDTLIRLGNIASGLSIPLGDMIYLFGTTASQGKLFTQDLRQFQGRGIPLADELAKQFGVTKDKVGELVTAGKVGFPEVQKAIESMTNEGGRFYNLMEKQSQTLSGQISNLSDAWDQMLNSIGEDTQGVASATIAMAAGVVENYERIGKVISSLIGVYGIYRTALILNSLITEGFNKAIWVHITATKAATIAQDIYNKVLLMHPLVRLGAIAVSAGLAMWALHDSTTAAEKAQKRLNDRIEEQKKKTEEHKAKIEELINTTNSETETEYERNKALKALKELYPEIFEKYDIEALKLADILSLKKQIAEIEEQKTFQSDKDYYVSLVNKRDKMDKELSYRSQNYGNGQYKYGEFQSKTVNELKKEHEGLAKEIDLMYSNIMDRSNTVWDKTTPKQVKIISLERNIEDLKKEKEELEKIVNPDGNYVTGDKSAYNPMGQMASPEAIARLQVVNGLLADQSKELGSLKQPLGASISPNITKEIADTTKKVADLNQQIADLRNGKGKADEGKTIEETINAKISDLNAAEKALETLTGRDKDASKKAAEEQKKRLEQQKAIATQLLDLRRQNQQDEIDLMAEGSEKKIAQINLDYDKEITAILAKEKEWKDAQGGKLTQEQTAEIRMAKVNAGSKLGSATTDVINEELENDTRAMNEYLIKYGEYQEKRKAIADKYNDLIAKATTEGEKKSLDKDMTKALSDLDVEANKTTAAISLLFGDMSNKTVADMRTIADEGEKALKFLQNGQWDTATGQELGISEETFKTLKDSPEELDAIAKAIIGIRKEADQCETSFNKISGGLKKVFSAGDDSIKLREGLAEIEAGMGDVMQAGQFLSNSLSKLGDSFGNDTLTGISDGIGVAMDAMGSAMDGAKAGAAFGPWGAAAGAAIGMVTSLASSFAKIHDAKNEKRIQVLQEQIEVLDKTYEKLGESVEKAYSKDASNLIDQQNKLLEQQKVLIQQQIREEEDKKKTDNGRIKEWREQIEDINETIADNKEKAVDAIFGEDLKSAIENFASAYADVWASGEDKAKSAKDTVKNMMRQMVTESIKAAMESSGAMERIRAKLEEFYADNVLSGWEQDYIYNMAEDLQKELDRQFGWADSLMKDDTTDETSTREASSKGIASISQDSANLIDGKMSTQLIFSDKTLVEVTGIREQIQFIYNLQAEGWKDVKAIRDLSGKVSENTAKVAEISERIEVLSGEIAGNTKSTAKGIQDMNDKGLLMRAR